MKFEYDKEKLARRHLARIVDQMFVESMDSITFKSVLGGEVTLEAPRRYGADMRALAKRAVAYERHFNATGKIGRWVPGDAYILTNSHAGTDYTSLCYVFTPMVGTLWQLKPTDVEILKPLNLQRFLKEASRSKVIQFPFSKKKNKA